MDRSSRHGKTWASVGIVACTAVYLFNAPWLAPAIAGSPRLLAHRGVHQDFDRIGLASDGCTATRIREPIAPEIENTIGSMRAAFELGAEVVELDVHPTTDGQFAVFHDWTLDCRTEGTGRARDHTMAYLKTLDVGFGYTADGGRSFPLRGKGVGLIPSFDDVVAAFPGKHFLVNFKSHDPAEGELFAAALNANQAWRAAVWAVYGGQQPTKRALQRSQGLKGFTRASEKRCLLGYLLLGWAGYVPEACRNTIVLVPQNYKHWLWGWPNRFLSRMSAVGTEVVLRGPYGEPGMPDGIDTVEQAALVPRGFPGLVWTNEIARVAPLVTKP